MLFSQINANAYDISDAVRSAIKTNDTLKTKHDNMKLEKLDKAKVFTEYMPSFVYSNSYVNSEVINSEADKGQLIRNNYGNHQEDFKLSQNIFNGGGSFYRLQQAKNKSKAAEYNYQQSKNDTILEAATSYQNILAERSSYNVAKEKEETARKIYEQVQIKFDLGVETRTSLAEAKASLATTIAEKQKAFGDLKNAEAIFVQVVGELPPSDMDPIEENKIDMPSKLEVFLDEMDRENLTIAEAKYRHIAAKFDILSSISKMLPSVNFEFYTQSPKPLLSNSGQKKGDTYSLSVKVPIFQSGTEYVGIRESKIKERLAKHTWQKISSDIITKAVKAWNDYEQSKVASLSLAEALDHQELYLDGMRTEFSLGTKSLKDLLDAEFRYAKIKNDVIKNKLNLVISMLNIRYILGNIDKVKIITSKI